MNERWLHDYLDGRLSAKEQARAEERLRDDAELAARVEELREIGRTLREDSAELPPGFYTRARARFERSGKDRSPLVHRLFSWEAAGLAVAMVLVAGLFLPGLLRGPEPVMQRPVPQSAQDHAGTREPSARREPPAPEVVTELDLQPSAAGEFAPAPAAAPELPQEAPGRIDSVAKRRLAAQPLEQPVTAVALPRDVSIPDGVRIVADRASWPDWLRGPAGKAVGRLGEEEVEAEGRLVLVGRSAGIDCAGLRVVRAGDEYRIRVDDDRGPATGCAFVLPADGLAIRLERREGETK